jgi:excisionase family DNA binding protein
MLLVQAEIAAPMDDKEETLPEILTIQEMANHLRVHRSTIYRLIWRRELPVFRVGSDWRITRPALLEWVSRQTTSGTPLRKR